MITVAVIDDHPIYREGLARAVATSDRWTVIGTYESVDEYLAAAPGATVVLLDYQLPGLSGPAAVRALGESGATVLMVSADIGREAVLETLGAGARGYVAKHAEPPEILEAIGIVSDAEHPGTYVSPVLASFLLDASKGSGPDMLDLSEREQEVLGLVAAGERDPRYRRSPVHQCWHRPLPSRSHPGQDGPPAPGRAHSRRLRSRRGPAWRRQRLTTAAALRGHVRRSGDRERNGTPDRARGLDCARRRCGCR